ncbi:MAG: sulfite exporter TauE/SafE family protein [Candidatus Paraimprobicoccus trichonymphae]|uniref:Probable membrane transporter protein n=1 Tax=Candidatus Paraimprobicoccus trichonymphae TaxID=3033793 RepID=A0AA48KZR2_9FIRM|nr:MAG: sulfite exporter TauE/SafE family protein [Candidatus Paraimprobicoccus trichonymphae]
MNFLLSSLAGSISGMLAAMGLGGGSVLIMYLTVVEKLEQTKSQNINLIFFIPIALVAVIFYIKKKLIDFKLVLIVLISGIPSTILGSYLSQNINKVLLSKIFGTLLLITGIIQLFHRPKK